MDITENREAVQEMILQFYKIYDFETIKAEEYSDDDCILNRDGHAVFAHSKLAGLPGGMKALDAGQPWFLFWITNALELLDNPKTSVSDEQKSKCVKHLKQC
jgi:prenyltransferase beta subunit